MSRRPSCWSSFACLLALACAADPPADEAPADTAALVTATISMGAGDGAATETRQDGAGDARDADAPGDDASAAGADAPGNDASAPGADAPGDDALSAGATVPVGPSTPAATGLLAPSGRELPPPALRSPSLVVFEPFGPYDGQPPEQYAQALAWLAERFYGDPEPDRRAELDALVAGVHVVDLTGAYLDLVIGLDLADADDVQLAGAITREWFDRQQRYKQLVLDADPTHTGPGWVAGRLAIVDGWRRLWERTVADPQRIDRYRDRVDVLLWERRRLDLGPIGGTPPVHEGDG